MFICEKWRTRWLGGGVVLKGAFHTTKMTRNEEHAPSVRPIVKQIVKKAAARGAEASDTDSQPIINAIDAFRPFPRAKMVISTEHNITYSALGKKLSIVSFKIYEKYSFHPK